MSGPKTSFLLHAVRVIDPAAAIDAELDVVVVDGVVEACDVGAARRWEGRGLELRDAKGTVLVPGLTDLRTELGFPGKEYRESALSGLQAAAAGGFTQICPLPNGAPAADDPLVVQAIVHEARRIGLSKVSLLERSRVDSKVKNLLRLACWATREQSALRTPTIGFRRAPCSGKHCATATASTP